MFLKYSGYPLADMYPCMHMGGILTYVLLGEGVDELGKDLVGDDGLGEFVGVVGEAAQSERSRLLNGGHVVEEEGSQESHHTYGKH